MKISKNLLSILSLNIFVLFLAIYFAIEFGYGIESEPGMFVFMNLIENGEYRPSRYFGQPVSEIILGFIGYFFGGKVANFFCFFLFNLSLYFFYHTFYNRNNQKNALFLFLLLCFSNSSIFLQSSEVSDFPVALFFLSLGFFLYRKKQTDLSIIIFSLCVASRSHFLLYILGFILYDIYLDKSSFKEKLKYIILLLFVSFLFYLPMFYESKLSLSFINNSGGVGLVFSELWPRFVYKIYKVVGVFSSIAIFFYILINLKVFYNFCKKEKYLILIIVINLITFFLMPSKYAILQPAMILLYLIFSKFINKKIIFIIVFLNIFEWFSSYQIIEIKYKHEDICFGKGRQAVGAIINFSVDKGNLLKHYENLSIKECWAIEYYKSWGRHKNYLNDSKLKIK